MPGSQGVNSLAVTKTVAQHSYLWPWLLITGLSCGLNIISWYVNLHSDIMARRSSHWRNHSYTQQTVDFSTCMVVKPQL